MISRFRLCGLLAFVIFPGMLAAQSDDLLTRIWDGVQQAQKKYTSGCGTITETRTSSLLVKPMVLRGKFCAEGTDPIHAGVLRTGSVAHSLQRELPQRYDRWQDGDHGSRKERSPRPVLFQPGEFCREPEEEFHHHRAGGSAGISK